MKKVLFATTALIATAGVAAADVKLSGYGRMGIYYNESASTETSFTSRFRLNIDGTTTADNGVTFGARVRLQGNSGTDGFTDAPAFGAARFYAMTGGLTVAGGNILGAIDSMPNLYHGSVGLTGLSYQNVVTDFNADDFVSSGDARSGVEVIYEADMYTVHASYSDPEGMAPGQQSRIAAAVSGTFSGYTLALGYQDSNYGPDVEFVVTAGGSFGPASVAGQFAQDHNGDNQYTLSLEADVAAATSIQAYFNYSEKEATEESYGIGFKQDLGGGASLRGGVVSDNDVVKADLGVLFNF